MVPGPTLALDPVVHKFPAARMPTGHTASAAATSTSSRAASRSRPCWVSMEEHEGCSYPDRGNLIAQTVSVRATTFREADWPWEDRLVGWRWLGCHAAAPSRTCWHGLLADSPASAVALAMLAVLTTGAWLDGS